MKPAQIALVLGLFVALIIGTTGCDTLLPNKEAELIASGIVEANQVAVSSELGGQVIEVLVEEGETVDAGEGAEPRWFYSGIPPLRPDTGRGW